MRKLKLRKVKKLSEGHQLAEWQQPQQLDFSTGAPGCPAVPPTVTKGGAPESPARPMPMAAEPGPDSCACLTLRPEFHTETWNTQLFHIPQEPSLENAAGHIFVSQVKLGFRIEVFHLYHSSQFLKDQLSEPGGTLIAKTYFKTAPFPKLT